jgi:hypothetical protein
MPAGKPVLGSACVIVVDVDDVDDDINAAVDAALVARAAAAFCLQYRLRHTCTRDWHAHVKLGDVGVNDLPFALQRTTHTTMKMSDARHNKTRNTTNLSSLVNDTERNRPLGVTAHMRHITHIQGAYRACFVDSCREQLGRRVTWHWLLLQ